MDRKEWLLREDGIGLSPITVTDALTLNQLMKRIYPPIYQHLWPDQGRWYLDHAYGMAAIKQDLQEEDASYWFVKKESERIGILRLKTYATLPEEPFRAALQLHRIYLGPALIGQGFGQRLLAFTREKAQALGKELLWLEVMDSQQAAIRFYEKNGFRICGAFRLPYEQMYPQLRGMYRMKLEL